MINLIKTLNQLSLKQLQQLAQEFQRPVKHNKSVQINTLLFTQQVGGFIRSRIPEELKENFFEQYTGNKPAESTLKKLEHLEAFLELPLKYRDTKILDFLDENQIDLAPDEWFDALVYKDDPPFENIPKFLATHLKFDDLSNEQKLKMYFAAVLNDSVELFKLLIPDDVFGNEYGDESGDETGDTHQSRQQSFINYLSQRVAFLFDVVGVNAINILEYISTKHQIDLTDRELIKSAIKLGNLDTAKFLIEHGADPNTTILVPESPNLMRAVPLIDIARQAKHQDIVDYLTNILKSRAQNE